MRRKEMRDEAALTLPDEKQEEARENEERLHFGAGTTAQPTPSLERQIESAERLDRGEAGRVV